VVIIFSAFYGNKNVVVLLITAPITQPYPHPVQSCPAPASLRQLLVLYYNLGQNLQSFSFPYCNIRKYIFTYYVGIFAAHPSLYITDFFQKTMLTVLHHNSNSVSLFTLPISTPCSPLYPVCSLLFHCIQNGYSQAIFACKFWHFQYKRSAFESHLNNSKEKKFPVPWLDLSFVTKS
jgi:hypothetical protein